MRVLITGATGTIGKKVAELCLRQGITVNYLTTAKEKIKHKEDYNGYYWNPKKGEIDSACLHNVDAVIHLAGASVAKRWTSAYKEEIIESRIVTANLLYDTLKKHPHQVKQFISAGGISIYEDVPEILHTENSTKTDNSFLAQVVSTWESAADKFTTEGIAVAKVRTGMVLDQNEGAFPKLVKPVRLGFGAALGSGKQWQSWIHVEDIARMYVFIFLKNLSGVFNAVAPNPVTNKELTKAIAKKLRKPLWLPNVPAAVLKLVLGEMAILALAGQKVSSAKIEKEGFQFLYPTVESALNELLGENV